MLKVTGLIYRIKKANTAQKMKFSIKDFFRKCEQIRRKLRIWSNLLKKPLMKKLIFCAVMALSLFPDISLFSIEVQSVYYINYEITYLELHSVTIYESFIRSHLD